MKKIILTSLIISILSSTFAQNINSVFKEKWNTDIGLTTFRTNIVYDDFSKQIIIGSNGKSRALFGDDKDGVYLINPHTGKINTHLKTTKKIDADVNGVAVSDKYIYFGNDNSMFYCSDKKGKKVWEFSINNHYQDQTGDVEGCPALLHINNDGVFDVVFTVEETGLIALDGKTGKLLWDFLSHSSAGYLNSPAIYDLNKDGVKDIIFGAENDSQSWYGDRAVALNGKTGEVLWSTSINSGIHASTLVLERDNEVEIIITECYSTLNFLNTSGEIIKYREQNMNTGGISGLFSSPVITEKEKLVIGTSWWGEEDGVWFMDIDNDFLINGSHNQEYENNVIKFVETGKVSASAFVADVLKSSSGQEVGICTEDGELIIFSETGSLLKRLKLPGGAEASPLVSDIDNDGKLEILIACLNGKLYCYDTDSKGKVFWGQFRGDNTNQGLVKLN